MNLIQNFSFRMRIVLFNLNKNGKWNAEFICIPNFCESYFLLVMSILFNNLTYLMKINIL